MGLFSCSQDTICFPGWTNPPLRFLPWAMIRGGMKPDPSQEAGKGAEVTFRGRCWSLQVDSCVIDNSEQTGNEKLHAQATHLGCSRLLPAETCSIVCRWPIHWECLRLKEAQFGKSWVQPLGASLEVARELSLLTDRKGKGLHSWGEIRLILLNVDEIRSLALPEPPFYVIPDYFFKYKLHKEPQWFPLPKTTPQNPLPHAVAEIFFVKQAVKWKECMFLQGVI